MSGAWVYCELPIMIASLLGIHPHSLFVFSNQAQDDWHFINAKYDESESPNPLAGLIY
jgi:hypothetical protein